MTLTPVFLTGFEQGLSVNTNAVFLYSASMGTGSATLGATYARSGGYGCRLVLPASASSYYRPLQLTGKVYCVRFALRLVSLPTTDIPIMSLERVSANAMLIVTPNGALKASQGGTNFSTVNGASVLGPAINDGGWHIVEMRVDASSGTTVLEWRVDGIVQTSMSFTYATSAYTGWTFANPSYASIATGITFDIDDCIIGTWTTSTDWWGNGEILAQKPGSDGTHTFTGTHATEGTATTTYITSSTTNAYTMVDDMPFSTTRSSTDNIAQRAAATEYAEIAPATTAHAGQANAVRAYAGLTCSSNQNCTAAVIVRNSAGFALALFGDLPTAQGGGNGALGTLTSAAMIFRGGFITAPVAGWTATEVNAIRWRFGGSDDASPTPELQMLLFEADWPIAMPVSTPRLTLLGAG